VLAEAQVKPQEQLLGQVQVHVKLQHHQPLQAQVKL